MAQGLFLKGLEQLLGGNIDMDTDTIKLAPMSTSYTFNAGTQSFWSDISSDLASGATAITLTTPAINIDTGNSRVEFDAADIAETNQTFTTGAFVIYKDTGVASTSPLIMYGEYTEGTLSPVDGDFNLTVNAEGFFSIASA